MDVSAATPKPPFYFRLFSRCSANLLTVLCYHRIADDRDGRFQGYRPNISASRADFTAQMDFLRAHYNPIALSDLVAFLSHDKALPPRPALVTFDDGYRDNGEVAWPIMRERGVPLAVFLATDYIGTGRPFVWDLASYYFFNTTKAKADLPLIGSRSLGAPAEREEATSIWLETLKRKPGLSSETALTDLQAALEVRTPSPEVFSQFCLTWSDVQRLAHEGVEFGGHTRTHPILTNLPLSEATAEINNSLERLTASLGAAPLAFAYPNGSHRDFNPDHESAVRQCGVAAGFSLRPGPTSLGEVRERPMAIRRIYVGAEDTGHRFAAKLTGAARIVGLLRSSNATA